MFPGEYHISSGKKIRAIIITFYILMLTVLYASYITSAKYDALERIKSDMQKRRDTFVLSLKTESESLALEMSSAAEDNTLRMPLMLGLQKPISDFVNSRSVQTAKGFDSITVLDKNSSIVLSNSRHANIISHIKDFSVPVDIYFYDKHIFHINSSPIFYKNPSDGTDRSFEGAIAAVYDILDFHSLSAKAVEGTAYTFYGYADGRPVFIMDEKKAEALGVPEDSNVLPGVEEGFGYIPIDGRKTLSLVKYIPLANTNSKFALAIAIPPKQLDSEELESIMRSLVAGTFTVLLITIIMAFADFTLRHYISREMSSRFEIQDLRLQQYDFSKHLKVIGGMTAAGEYGELKKYVDSLSERVILAGNLSKLDNPAVNVLLQEKELTANENGIRFNIDIRSSLKNIGVRASDLCTMLANLIDNAIEASLDLEAAEREIWVEIGFRDGNYLFSVSNRGLPIPENMLEKIFRAGYTSKKDKKGHGMGLYIVRRILGKYKGSIEVRSEDGRTIFTALCIEGFRRIRI